MSRKIVDIKDLHVRIGKKQVLKGLNIAFYRGEYVVIAGKSGAGKSTFLRCLSGSILPDAGWIVPDKDLSRKKIGFISDGRSLFSHFTISRMVNFHTRIYGIKNFDNTLIKELKLSPGRKIKSLSMGERTLFHLTLVLNQKPDLLLVDEVIHAIDPFLRERFLESVLDIIEERGTATIAVNHTFSDIEKIPERVLILDEGRFILDEKTDDLKNRLKKVATKEPLPKNIPVVFKKETGFCREYFIYPFDEKFRRDSSFLFEDIKLEEIIKAFIGGRYV
ncbi:MAG: ABC transporter ATP-binding protein [Candidatus Aminicenantes bacterium]|nr:ABC transporter ATP-binding protein [Candidatus Aminicenantes bacterium]